MASTLGWYDNANVWVFFTTGDYFIAELIESQDEHHRTVVAEVCKTLHTVYICSNYCGNADHVALVFSDMHLIDMVILYCSFTQ